MQMDCVHCAVLQFMFNVFNNIGFLQYAYIEASVHGHKIFKIGLHIFCRA
jgi:hypothetical protein